MSGVAATVVKKVENKKFSQMAFDCYLIRDHFFLTLELPQSLIFFASLLPTSAASSSFFIWISLEIELRKKHSLCPHVQLFFIACFKEQEFFTAKQMWEFFFLHCTFFQFSLLLVKMCMVWHRNTPGSAFHCNGFFIKIFISLDFHCIAFNVLRLPSCLQ